MAIFIYLFLFCTLEDVCICIATSYILRLIVIIICILNFSLSLIYLWPTTWVVDSIHWVQLHLQMILDNFALYIICINISNKMWYKMFWHLQAFSVYFTRYSRCSFPSKYNGSMLDIIWRNFGSYGIDQSSNEPADDKSYHTCNDDHCKNWSSSKIDQIGWALLFMCFCFIHSCVNEAYKI